MLVTKGKALDLLKTQPKLERFSGEAIREIAVSPGVIKMNLKDLLLLSFHSEGDTIAIYMGTEADQTGDGEDKPTEVGILGYALFKHGQMVDVFTGDAAKGLTWLTRQPPLLDYRIEDQGVQLTVLVDQGMTHIRPVLHGNRIDFETTIRARATIAEEESLLDVLSEERMRKLEERLNEQIKQSVLQAVEIIQKHQVDPVGLETLVHKTHPELWRTKFSKQWDSYVKQAQFPVKVNCSIGRIGIFSDTDRKK
jgi:Ger(x)C family germination protein